MTMNLKLPIAVGAAVLFLAHGAAGGPVKHADGISRVVEMPAHKALHRVVSRPDSELAPFTTDGCSGGLSGAWNLVADQFPEFENIHLEAPPFEGCCVTHDRAYHNAGGATSASASFEARLQADRALEACVVETK